jgi:hypothetical protein
MRTLRQIRLPQVENVGAGKTAVINLPRGPRYFAVFIDYRANTTAGYTDATHGMDQIRCTANGTAFRTFTPAGNEFHNRFFRGRSYDGSKVAGALVTGNANNNVFVIEYAPSESRNQAEADALAIGTLDLGSFQIELDIKSGASNPTMRAWALIEDVSADSPLATSGEVIRQSIYGVAIGGAGNLDVNQYPQDIDFLHYFRAAAATNINGVVVDATFGGNRQRVLELDAVNISNDITSLMGIGQDAARYAPFSVRGLLTEGLPTRINGVRLAELNVRLIAGGAVTTNLEWSGIGRIVR